MLDNNSYSMSKGTGYLYLDTNILCYVADHPSLWSSLRTLLYKKRLRLAISDVHFAELHDATRKHEKIADLFCFVPACLINSGENLLRDEIHAYPNTPDDPLFLSALSSQTHDRSIILTNLRSQQLQDSRSEMRHIANHMHAIIVERMQNFKPSPTGVYTKKQAPLFVHHAVIQQLMNQAPEFLLRFQDDHSRLSVDSFLSLRLGPLVAFFKYYLGKRRPIAPNDLGDQLHLQYFLYCNLVITEKDNAEIFSQAQTIEPFPDTLTIETIDFVRNIESSMGDQLTNG